MYSRTRALALGHTQDSSRTLISHSVITLVSLAPDTPALSSGSLVGRGRVGRDGYVKEEPREERPFALEFCQGLRARAEVRAPGALGHISMTRRLSTPHECLSGVDALEDRPIEDQQLPRGTRRLHAKALGRHFSLPCRQPSTRRGHLLRFPLRPVEERDTVIDQLASAKCDSEEWEAPFNLRAQGQVRTTREC
jgi:hypothetical protein